MNIRTKGQNGEREAAAYLNYILGKVVSEKKGCLPPLERNLNQTRSGGADIVGIPGLCIEVKRQETLVLNTWWRQVCRAADENGDIPVLMYRKNREKWSFCLPAYLLLIGMSGRITLGESEFAQWLTHYLE